MCMQQWPENTAVWPHKMLTAKLMFSNKLELSSTTAKLATLNNMQYTVYIHV